MGRWGKADFKELKALEQRIAKLETADYDRFYQETAKEIAARILAKVKKRTPVGVVPKGLDKDTYQKYWAGYSGGTLRDAWTILPIEKRGNEYVITIVNPTEYASYVEYGHRQTPGRFVPALGKRLKSGWVKGRYMLTISIQEVETMLPAILEKRLYKLLKGVFDAE